MAMLTNMAITINDLKDHYQVKRSQNNEETRIKAIEQLRLMKNYKKK